MSRRYLDSKTKNHYKRLSRFDDKPKYLTEAGPKIPEFDEALKAPRTLYINDIKESLDVDDILAMKIMELVNAVKETRHYVEQTNTHLIKQNARINELKNLQKSFESQVGSLESKD